MRKPEASLQTGPQRYLLCKGKRKYMLTLQVSRYCLLPLQNRTDNRCAWPQWQPMGDKVTMAGEEGDGPRQKVKNRSCGCSWCVCDVSVICLWWVCDVSAMCLWCVCDVSVMCLWCVCDVLEMCLWCVSDVSVMCLWCVCDESVMSMWCVCDESVMCL